MAREKKLHSIDKEELKKFYDRYIKAGFCPILCRGYSNQYNSEKDYKKAKAPISSATGYTKSDYKEPTLKECIAHIDTDGWLGWLIPKDFVAIDLEDEAAIQQLFSYIDENNLNVPTHKTLNGYHFLFKNPNKVEGGTQVLVNLGFYVTYRNGGKSYLILAPIDNRKWVGKTKIQKTSDLPNGLYSLDTGNKSTVLDAIDLQLSYSYKSKMLNGHEDIDFAYMAFLVKDLNLDVSEVCNRFSIIYDDEFDQNKTENLYDSVISKEKFRGIGSLIKKLKEQNLSHIIFLINLLQNKKKERLKVSSDITDYLLKPGELDIECESLIDGLIFPYTLYMLFGRPGCGKSYLSLLLACALLSQQCVDVIIYLDGDNPKRVLKRRRIDTLVKYFGENKFMYFPGYKFIDNKKVFFLDLLDSMDENKRYFIIVDSIRKFITGDPNTDSDAGAFMGVMEKLRDKGENTIILIHHVGKNKSGEPKNNTSFLDYIDVSYLVEKNNNSSSEDIELILEVKKNRSGDCENMIAKIKPNTMSLKISNDFIPLKSAEIVNAIQIVLGNGIKLNQSQLKSKVSEKIKGLDNNKFSEVINAYEGIYWKCETGMNNSKSYSKSVSTNKTVLDWNMSLIQKTQKTEFLNSNSNNSVQKTGRKPID